MSARSASLLRFLGRLCSGVLLGVVLCCGAAAQENGKDAAAPDPLLPFLKSGWNEVDTSWMSARLGFAALEDGAFYSQNAASKQQVGSLTPEGLFRVDDLLLSGQIKFAHPWTYVVGGNYKGLDPTSAHGWTTTYLYVSIPLGALGFVTVGKQKEGLGLEMVENGRDLPFLERSTLSTAFAFVDSHLVGIRFSNTVADGRMTWSAGWFNNWLDDGLTFDQSGSVFGGRVTGLALEADGGRSLIHLGVSGAYRQSKNGSFQLKSVPEVYEAPDFVDTGSFSSNHGASVGGELAVVHGPLTISGEYAVTGISTPTQAPDLHFSGYYAMATWSLTGETRPYDHALGAFGAINPSAPFSFRNGGPGAWEVAARYSSVDLTSGTVQGGKFDRLSGALSWYPTSQVRFEFDYGCGRLERSGLVGHTNFYQLRLQFQL